MINAARYIFKREIAFLAKRKKSRAFFVCLYPFVIMGLLLAVFSGKVLTQIPIAVVDNSQGYYARETVRAFQANQFLHVSLFPTLGQAFAALENGSIYGVVSLDKDYDKNKLKHTGSEIVAWINNEYLLVGGNTNKGINSVVGGLNQKYQWQNLAELGIPAGFWKTMASPLQVSETVLYNPTLNYIYFLGLGLLPAVLQLFICLSVCYSLLWEIKTRHAKRLRRVFQINPYIAAGSKIGFYIVAYLAVMLILLGLLVIGFGVPVQGSLWRTILAIAAFIFLTSSTALLFAAITNNLRLSMSVCAAYAAPAFAYFGVSFPVQSMPLLARGWAEFMPGTHLNRVFVNELLRGANASGTWGEIAFMIGLGLLFFCLGTKGYAHWTKKDSYLGPKL